MTGIYKLWWDETPMHYIGQSVDIDHRYRTHLGQLKRDKHASDILQQIYNDFGAPRLAVLMQCRQNDLDYHEQQFIYKAGERCCNIVANVPMRTVGFTITKQDHQQLHTIAKTNGFNSVLDLAKNLLLRQLNGGE